MSKKRASWWPECPWSADIWSMTQEEFEKAVPDKYLRNAIFGFLMRQGWEIASEDIWKSLKDGTSIYDKLKDILLSEE